MGRLYNVKGWLEPVDECADSLIKIVDQTVAKAPDYDGLRKNWTLAKEFGFSEFVFFGATAKYADIMVEAVVADIVASNIIVDGYFECIDEEDENSWSLRIVDSKLMKTKLTHRN